MKPQAPLLFVLLMVGQSCVSTADPVSEAVVSAPAASAARAKSAKVQGQEQQVDKWRREIAEAEEARRAEIMRPERERQERIDAAEIALLKKAREKERRGSQDLLFSRFSEGAVVFGFGGSLYSAHEGAVHLTGHGIDTEITGGDISRLGASLSLDYFLSDQTSMRFSFDYRMHEPEPEVFSGNVMEFDGVGVSEFSVGFRHRPSVFLNRRVHKDDLWRVILGADITYIPEYRVDGVTDVGTNLDIAGGEYWIGSVNIGANTLFGDNIVFEIGVELDMPISPSTGTATFYDGVAPPRILDTEADTQNVHVFFRVGIFL